MKKLTILITLLVSVTTLTAIKYATIDGGRRVILNDNGTWKYVKSKIAIKPVEIGKIHGRKREKICKKPIYPGGSS